MRGRGFSFHSPVNSGEAGGHRSKPKIVLALQEAMTFPFHCRKLVNELSIIIPSEPKGRQEDKLK